MDYFCFWWFWRKGCEGGYAFGHLFFVLVFVCRRVSPAPGSPSPLRAPRFEAKYPCLLFKQQVDSNVTKIFSMLRENGKKAIAPLLAALMLQPKNAANRQASVKASSLAPPPGLSAADPIAAMILGPRSAWQELVAYFQDLLAALQKNHVPRPIVRRLFGQLALDINSQGFNQLVLRRECCSFSNGEYIKLGMAELETWLQTAGEEWVGDAFEELKYVCSLCVFSSCSLIPLAYLQAAACLLHSLFLPEHANESSPHKKLSPFFPRHLRQAVNFLVIDKKPRKTYEEIKEDLCKDLTVQQIYRLSTMYWDDRYGTETVSKDVMERMRMIMNAGGSAGTFILDSNSLVHASWEDLQQDAAGAINQMDLRQALPGPVAARLAGEKSDLGELAFLLGRFDPVSTVQQQMPAPAPSPQAGEPQGPPMPGAARQVAQHHGLGLFGTH